MTDGQCGQCGAANPTGAKFCTRCGAALSARCPHCEFANPPRARFCGACGTPLPAAPPASPSSSPVPAFPGEAERRQLTVLFCDLVGSTALAERLDPEELREVLQAYQGACGDQVRRFAGHIIHYAGDGLMVCFGYPRAQEDAPQCAVRAGLGILSALPTLNAHLQRTVAVLRDHPLRVRIGVHTGLVVVSQAGGGTVRATVTLVGETPHLVTRLQEVAGPDTLVISTATARLVEGFFTLQDGGAKALEGVTAPVRVYQVLDESGAQSRLEVVMSAGLPQLVGREQELAALVAHWGTVQTGTGQVVMVSGEGGLGKSLLVQALKAHTASQPHTWLECRCSPYDQNSTLHPVVDLIERRLQFSRSEPPDAKLWKLEAALSGLGMTAGDAVPLLASLLSLPLPAAHHPTPAVPPQRQRQKTLDALLAWVRGAAEQRPVLFVVEDLQWADPSTLEALGLLAAQVRAARVFVLLTCRPEFHPPWSPDVPMTRLVLDRLPRRAVEAIVVRAAGGAALPREIVEQIVQKTDGVPLFAEELTKAVTESGAAHRRTGHTPAGDALPALAIPATLHDSLMARLDRLPGARETAQLGATLGREFSYELIRAVSPAEEPRLRQALGDLVAAELLFQRGDPPRRRYIFKHALIQDAAYQTLLKSKRQQYHQRIARVLEDRFPETAQARPELLAHHYTEAGQKALALPYWQQAGQQALARSSNPEAISHLTRALALLQDLPATQEHPHHELSLQLALGTALVTTHGYAAPAVEAVYARARTLCEQLGETPQLFPVLLGLWGFYSTRADLKTALTISEQVLRIAELQGDTVPLVGAHQVYGVTQFYLGRLPSAGAHLEASVALYDPGRHRAHPFAYAVADPAVASLSYAALTLWLLGYSDQALRKSQEALALADSLSHPFSQGFALSFAAVLHQLRREDHLVQEKTARVVTLAREQAFSQWLALGTILQCWALTARGSASAGVVPQLRQALNAYRDTGAELGGPYFLALLAEACGRVGQHDEGLSVLAGVLALPDRSLEYEAELHRLKGELLRQKAKSKRQKAKITGPRPPIPDPFSPSTQYPAPSTEEAEVSFLRAVEVARQQQARSLELRATMSLCLLRRDQGRVREACQLLADTYGWFTEGFDSPDLRRAKVLLEELRVS